MKTMLLFALAGLACVVQAQPLGQAQPPVPTPGNVTLPLDQYNQLVDRAGQAAKPMPEPPVPHVLNKAQLTFQVSGESVAGTVSIQGEVLARDPRMVPLVRGMVVRQARLDQATAPGRAAPPSADLPVEHEQGVLSVVLPGSAPFSVTLDAAVPLIVEPGKASFNLTAPNAGAVEATFTIPGDQTQVNLNPGLITNRTSRGGKTVVQATLVPGQIANLWWASRLNTPEAPAPPKDVRFLSDVKTLITVGESEIGLAALTEVTVVQGEPKKFIVHAPAGYELTGASGQTLASTESQGNSIGLNVTNPALRSHQFLITLARSNTMASAQVPLLTFDKTQRETGEVLVEGEGAMDLTATERGVLRRMDLKETNPYLRSMARGTLHTAFRYQKKPAETPSVDLAWVRFPASKMLSAVAQQAVVTTLVTSEGRSLTEVKLTLRNQSQPFLKVDLPAGASILSADVGGEKVKPVQGADGNRVPLLRPGFRPTGSYTVSFVFLHAGAPFAKKGDAELALPKMDLPIARVEWEVFLPQQYKVADFAGDVLPARLLVSDLNGQTTSIRLEGSDSVSPVSYIGSAPGGIFGRVLDPAGAVIAAARVQVKSEDSGAVWNAIANQAGLWGIPDLPSGRFSVMVSVQGFKTYVRSGLNHQAGVTIRQDVTLQVGSATESVTVTADAPLLKTESGELSHTVTMGEPSLPGFSIPTQAPRLPPQPPSANVGDLQRRVTGVLPIAVNVPRTGSSYHFVRELAVDEETKVTFRYRTARQVASVR